MKGGPRIQVAHCVCGRWLELKRVRERSGCLAWAAVCRCGRGIDLTLEINAANEETNP